MAFYQIGQHFPASAGDAGVLGTRYTGPELVRASIAHGVVGGVGSSIQGGRFGHGFAAAGFGKLATPAAISVTDNVYGQAVAVSIVGGTASSISGGKFANGAVTAAMGFALNQWASESRAQSDAGEQLANIELTFEGEGLERLRESAEIYEVTNLFSDVLPSGEYNVTFTIDDSLRGTTTGMQLDPPFRVRVNPEFLQRPQRILGSAIGHEFIQIRDYLTGNLNQYDPRSVARSEVRAYRWQSSTAGHFGLTFSERERIINQTEFFRALSR